MLLNFLKKTNKNVKTTVFLIFISKIITYSKYRQQFLSIQIPIIDVWTNLNPRKTYKNVSFNYFLFKWAKRCEDFSAQ